MDKSILLISSYEGALTARSGYNILSDYMPDADVIQEERKHATGIFTRIADAVVSRISLSLLSRRSSLILEYRALRRIRRGDIKIVHVLWGDRDMVFLDLFKKKYNFKLCYSFHTTISRFNSEKTFNFPKRLNNIDCFILMSETQKPFFLARGINESKLKVVLHGIDNQYFSPDLLPVKSSKFRLLSVGNWERDFEFIRKICVELQGNQNIEIRIISLSRFKSIFEGLSNVNFISSNLSDDELKEEYKKATCFLMSVKDSTANNALLEALACGLPVIAERIGGIPEYTNNKCSILTKPKNLEEIVGAIRKMADSSIPSCSIL